MMAYYCDTARWDAIHDHGGLLVRKWCRKNYDDSKNTEVLDVGAGWGKYRELLPEYQVDACEVWLPTVDQEDLRSRYRRVYVSNIAELVTSEAWHQMHYHIAIFGDVLEHMDVQTARLVLDHTKERCDSILVVVPYQYHQGEEEGNPYQRHIQDDLTVEKVKERYPELSLLEIEERDWAPFKGVYVWRKS